MIYKGKILTIEGDKDANGNYTRARCCPLNKDGLVSRPLVIPFWLRGVFGNLSKGVEVVYSTFDDESGIILSRFDGEWIGQFVPGTVTIKSGDVFADNISLKHHRHGGVESGPSKTGEAE
jgi:hypothetical protein